MLKKDKNPAPPSSLPSDHLPPIEFNERVSRLLLVCLEGLCKLIPEKEYLQVTLTDLGKVIKKAIRTKPVTGIAQEIEDYFVRLTLENKFRETKKDVMKQIVFDLTETVQEFVTSSSNFDDDMAGYVASIEKADSVTDILALKETIIGEMNQIRSRSSALRLELEDHRLATQSLSQQLEQTEARALVDNLTNALNRNAYNFKISQLVREYERFKEVFSLMVIDIDNFKQFNDTYGHKAGDKILHSVSANIQLALRTSDLVFRYGGEEFVVLINKISPENACKLGEKIRSQVENDFFVDQNKKLKVTVSIGITCARDGDDEISLFERADEAMYEAKKFGRNRVETNF
jgi:diguanylate cyclase